ncbi:MAG TPA: DUF2333 family protein [Candidatus Eisenbacteria bacterium]|nr:DUF2333 family protein [Candidatus Eisenbacteria bacterium]
MRSALALALLLLVLAAAGPIVLHVTQNGHDVLPFSIAERYPDGTPFVRGEIYATTLAELVEHELKGLSGWRPNDFILWGPRLWADNNANRQLGILVAVRESTRVLKDHLTKVSATEYDPNLVAADTAFRNDMQRLMLPSAESKLREGVRALRAYVDGLHTTPPRSKPIEGRNVELIRLFQSWGDLLGDAHASLFKETEADGSPVSILKTDDYYYHAQGVAHALHHLTLAVAREYADDLINRPALKQLLSEVAAALGRAASTKPLVVLDGGPAGLFANHRRNLDAPIIDARQKLYSIREELEK